MTKTECRGRGGFTGGGGAAHDNRWRPGSGHGSDGGTAFMAAAPEGESGGEGARMSTGEWRGAHGSVCRRWRAETRATLGRTAARIEDWGRQKGGEGML